MKRLCPLLLLSLFVCGVFVPNRVFAQTIWSVLNTSKGGAGSLRAAVTQANSLSLDEPVIVDFGPLQFLPSRVIELSSALFLFRVVDFIHQSPSNPITLRAVSKVRHLTIGDDVGGRVTISGVRVENGRQGTGSAQTSCPLQ